MRTFLSSYYLETMGVQIWRQHTLPREGSLDFEACGLYNMAGAAIGLLCLESKPIPLEKEEPLFRLLDAMLAAVQLKRAPLFADDYVLQQDSLILVMGELLAQTVLRSQDPLDKLRAANLHNYQVGDAKVLVTYHPLDLLVEVANKAKAWEDLKKLRVT